MGSSQDLFELLKAFFDEVGWPYEPELDTQALTVVFQAPQGERYLLAQAQADALCLFTSLLPLGVPQDEERVVELLRFLNELNGRLGLGTLYLDEEGESVQFTTAVDARDAQGELYPKEDLFRFFERSLLYNLQIHERLYPYVQAVSGGRARETALAEAFEALAAADAEAGAGEEGGGS